MDPSMLDERLRAVEEDVAALNKIPLTCAVHDRMLRGDGTTKPLPQIIDAVASELTALASSFGEFRTDYRDTWGVARNAIIVGTILLVLETTAGLAYVGLKATANASPNLSTHQKSEMIHVPRR